MGLFNNEDKQLEKAEKIMKKYHLEKISADYQEQVKEISTDLAGNKMIEAGTLLQGNAVDLAKLSYLSAIMKQNWIIIRLLDELAHK